MTYGEKLKILRKRKGMSQKELTKKLNLNRSTYARYKTSTTQPDYDTLKTLAKFHNVSIDYILDHNITYINFTDTESKCFKKEIKELMNDIEVWYQNQQGERQEKLEALKKHIKSFIEEN